jgi:lipopolysaccharide/colanic/teichoic acid biosynthesis glycosyltransferase
VKPGLTGWAQVNFHYGASLDDTREKLAYDLYYIKYASLTRELHIIVRTISTVLRGAL